MREDDYDPLTGYRTRTGEAQGGALERKLLGRFETVYTSRTAQHIHPNGDVTTVNTKNGMPEVVTTKAPVQEEGDYSYEIVGETTVDYLVSGWLSRVRAYKLNISKVGGAITCTRTEIPIDEYTGVTGTEWKKYHRNLRWTQPSTKRFVDFRGNLRKCGYGPLIGSGYNAFWGVPFLTYQGAISGVSMGTAWFDYSGTRVLTNINYINMATGYYYGGVPDLRAVWASAGYGEYVQGVYSPANPRVQYVAGVCLSSTPWSERINGVHRWDDSTGAHETLFTENATGTRSATYSHVRTYSSVGSQAASPPSSWSYSDAQATTTSFGISAVHEFPVGVDVDNSGIGRPIILRLETAGSSSGSLTSSETGEGENVAANTNWKTIIGSSNENDFSQSTLTLSLVCGTTIAEFTAHESASTTVTYERVVNYAKVDNVVTTDVSTEDSSGVQTFSPTVLNGAVMSHPEARVAALFVRRVISNPPTYTSVTTYATDNGTITDNTTTNTTRAADSNILTAVVVDLKNGRTKEFSYGMFTSGPTWTGLPADTAADFITTGAFGTGLILDTPPADPDNCGGSRSEHYVLGYNGAPEGWFVTTNDNLSTAPMMDGRAIHDTPHGPDGILKPATVWANDDLILFSGVTPFAPFAAESSHHFYIIDRKTGATKKIEGQGSYWKFYEALKVVPT